MNEVSKTLTVGIPPANRCPSYVLGDLIDLHNIPLDKIRVVDVANTLAKINRYNGRTPEPYSVAQHAVFVSRLVEKRHAYAALHHDSAEAFTGDLISPLKREIRAGTRAYDDLEHDVWEAVRAVFGLNQVHPIEVREADELAYFFESGILQGRAIALPGPEHYGDFRNLADIKAFLRPMHWRRAAALFIDRHLELMPESHGRLIGEDE